MYIINNLIMWGCLLWMPWLMYAMLKNEAKPKKNIIVGTTLPQEAHGDPQVKKSLESYKKELLCVTWLTMLPAIPGSFVKSFGLSMTLWLTWVVVVCFIPMIPYVRCNRALRKIKEERGWKRQTSQRVAADLRAVTVEMKWLSPLLFVPPFLISLIPLLFDRELWPLWLILAVMVGLFYLGYRFLYRNRAEMVDHNTERTVALTRIRRYNWGKMWLLMAWATGILNPLIWLTLDRFWGSVAVALIYTVVVVWAALSIEFRVRRSQEKLCEESGKEDHLDEDDNWIWGMFYYNPNDSHLVVNARVGMNSTINLARRSGQFLTVVLLLILLACPLTGIWMIKLEHTPVELTVTETELVATHYMSEYAVALEDIETVRLLEELPILRRVGGNGLPNARTGVWSSNEWGRLTCCIDPRTGPWLLVETEDDRSYLFNSMDQAETLAVLETLT